MKNDMTTYGPPAFVMHKACSVVAGLALPLLLIPIVRFTQHSEIMEEVAKAIVIVWLVLPIPRLRSQIVWALAFAFAFGLSESVFYLYRIMEVGDMGIFFGRLTSTVPMHMLTAAVMLASGIKGEKYLPFGLLAAIGIHLAFNYFI